MWHICLRFLAVTAVCLAQIQSDIDPYRRSEKRSRAQHYCGKHLANILQLVCTTGYNGPQKKKNEDVTIEESEYWLPQPLSGEEPQFPFRSRPKSTSLISGKFPLRTRRQSRGAYDECCLKPCTIDELRGYCLNE